MSDEFQAKRDSCEGSAPHAHLAADPECLAVFAKLSDYVDGELSAADCDAIRAHISDCPPCIEFVESLRRSINAAQSLGVDEKPVALEPDVRERLRKAWIESTQRRDGSK